MYISAFFIDIIMHHTPQEIGLLYTQAATQKAKMPLVKFILLAVLGGTFIALGGLLSVMVAGGSPGILATNPGIVKFLSGALFPVGLMLVSIAGADLFTSDCAGQTLSFLQKESKLSDLLRIWGLSYVFNFVGAQFIAYCMSSQLGFFDVEPWQSYLHSMAEAKVNMDFYTVFMKGIGANWLVCLGVWMGFAGKDVFSRCVGIWIPVMIFVTLGYEHSIANMFFIPAAIYSGAEITWMQFISDNLIAATLGNIVGGAVFVGCVYWYIYLRKK